MLALLLTLGSTPFTASGVEGPTKQALVFYNARIAGREKRPKDVLRLWLLRNSLREAGEPTRNDGDFESVVWTALGELGLCADGYPEDEHGAGLWPLALHNWVVKAGPRGDPPPRQDPWDAFDVARQQRFISLRDVLSVSELKSATFEPTACWRTQLLDAGLERFWTTDLTDRENDLLLMHALLQKSVETLKSDKVQGRAVIAARLFDLDLATLQLQMRKRRRAAAEGRAQARAVGVSAGGAQELFETVSQLSKDSIQGRFLANTYAWPASEWLSLSRAQRGFLFTLSEKFAPSPAVRAAVALRIVDALVARREGEEAQAWIGFLSSEDSREALTEEPRAARLLALEPSTGFTERSVVALHQGVGALQAGELEAALRSFGYALGHAEESREAVTVTSLSRRWLSYVLSQFKTTANVVAILKALVPPAEYNAVIEDLLWRAAFRADPESFDKVVKSAKHGGSFDGEADTLRPLSRGKAGELVTGLRAKAETEPYRVVRFARKLVERLELEDADVRKANIVTLKLLRGVLDAMANGEGKGTHNANIRTAEELSDRVQSILEGLDQLDASVQGKAKQLAAEHETFAGNVRLAPSDELPWPFPKLEPQVPQAFAKLNLTPVEWRNHQNTLVFGWRISE